MFFYKIHATASPYAFYVKIFTNYIITLYMKKIKVFGVIFSIFGRKYAKLRQTGIFLCYYCKTEGKKQGILSKKHFTNEKKCDILSWNADMTAYRGWLGLTDTGAIARLHLPLAKLPTEIFF